MQKNLAANLDLGHLFRESTPLRVAFLHRPVARGGSGPLSAFVRQRRVVALDLLLFAHTVWPLSDSGSISAPSAAWADAIDIADKSSYRAIISRSWTWLEQAQLIRTAKQGKNRAIEIRREDGSDAAWTRPSEENEPFFHLPIAYWTGGFSRDLSLPAKAVLLIGLSLQSGDRSYFELPVERGAGWYGITPQSVRAGLQELREVGLLRTWVEKRTSDRSPLGHTFDRRHSLNSLEAVGSGRIRRGETDPSAGKSFEEIPF